MHSNKMELDNQVVTNQELFDFVEYNINLYSQRYQEGKDLFTGICLACKKEDCRCKQLAENGIKEPQSDYKRRSQRKKITKNHAHL